MGVMRRGGSVCFDVVGDAIDRIALKIQNVFQSVRVSA